MLFKRKRVNFFKYLSGHRNTNLAKRFDGPSIRKKNQRVNSCRNTKGFSLLEILIAMTLLVGVVAGLVYRVMPRLSQGQMRQARITINQLVQAVETFYMDCSFYPSNMEGLEALIVAPQKCESWGPEPYIKKVPKDPWGNHFIYEYDETNGTYQIISFGKGGKEGGEGQATDISSKDL